MPFDGIENDWQPEPPKKWRSIVARARESDHPAKTVAIATLFGAAALVAVAYCPKDADCRAMRAELTALERSQMDFRPVDGLPVSVIREAVISCGPTND
jgi:hypothetical protein